MSTIMTASHQWASRPSDQRFVSLLELAAFTKFAREHSKAKVLSSRTLQATPVEGDHKALLVVGPNGAPVAPTNWSFGQLASLSGAPAGYLRDLPGALAADCINYGLQHVRDIEDIGVLLYKNGEGVAELRACTGPGYGRVWNSTIAQLLVDRFGDGVSGQWKVPGEFGKDVPITKANTTLYASDRDLFVFLADEKNRIEIPNRRDGQAGSLSRGFFVWNSEVGKCKLGIATFLFDYVCCNRIVWGAEGYEEISIRHTVSAPDKWVAEVVPAIQAYARSSAAGVETAIADARASRVGNVDEFLRSRKFTNSQVSAIKAAHMADEQRPIETLWDATTAVTAYARGIEYQDERVDLERAAGKIMRLGQ